MTNAREGATSRPQALCLSGGGFLGLFSAYFLAECEQSIGRPIASCFDLIAGTSIGGITALAVALEIPMTRVVQFFEERGPQIFSARRARPEACVNAINYR